MQLWSSIKHFQSPLCESKQELDKKDNKESMRPHHYFLLPFFLTFTVARTFVKEEQVN